MLCGVWCGARKTLRLLIALSDDGELRKFNFHQVCSDLLNVLLYSYWSDILMLLSCSCSAAAAAINYAAKHQGDNTKIEKT